MRKTTIIQIVKSDPDWCHFCNSWEFCPSWNVTSLYVHRGHIGSGGLFFCSVDIRREKVVQCYFLWASCLIQHLKSRQDCLLHLKWIRFQKKRISNLGITSYVCMHVCQNTFTLLKGFVKVLLPRSIWESMNWVSPHVVSLLFLNLGRSATTTNSNELSEILLNLRKNSVNLIWAALGKHSPTTEKHRNLLNPRKRSNPNQRNDSFPCFFVCSLLKCDGINEILVNICLSPTPPCLYNFTEMSSFFP